MHTSTERRGQHTYQPGALEGQRGVFHGEGGSRWVAGVLLKRGLEDFWPGARGPSEVSLQAGQAGPYGQVPETQTHAPLHSRSAQGLRGTNTMNCSTSPLTPATTAVVPTAHTSETTHACSAVGIWPQPGDTQGDSPVTCHRDPALCSGAEVPTRSRLLW